MACVFYCLIRDPEQLDPLVDRLRDAGIRSEDIAVVLCRTGVLFSRNLTAASGLLGAVLDLSLRWSLAFCCPLASRTWDIPNPADYGPAVIPLADFQNKD